jgi:hypothetical protein
MALIVETGAGLPAADSYMSVQDALTYHTARGNVDWLHLTTVEAKERALRKATDYMTRVYRQAWKGQRVSSTQRLDWPRYDVCVDGYSLPSTTVPLEVAEACAELALRVLTGELNPDAGPQKVGVKVGPIEIKYAEGSRPGRRFPAVDSLLGPFLKAGGSGNSAMVVRS